MYFSNVVCTSSFFCRLTPLSTMISTRRSACLALPSRPAASIDSTSPSISRSTCVRFLALIHLTSCQAPQISISHTSHNSLALTFHVRLFYILSDNRQTTVKDAEDSNNVVVDGVLADILAHPFSPSSPRSNSPPGVTAAYSVRSHDNKFKFPFISLLTLLQGLTKFLMSGVGV